MAKKRTKPKQARRQGLSRAHRAAISAGLKLYHHAMRLNPVRVWDAQAKEEFRRRSEAASKAHKVRKKKLRAQWVPKIRPRAPTVPVVQMAQRQAYAGLPVVNVRSDRGAILGNDNAGRPLRAFAIINQQNARVTMRWTPWEEGAELPKLGGFLVDEEYESLLPARYVVQGVWR